MHHILEADYGIGPLNDVEDVIRSGFDKLFERNKVQPWFDGLWMNEYGEALVGALLVACQAYCVGCVSDINEIRKHNELKPLGKIDAYRAHGVSSNGVSAIELLNAGANCFKHRDEWGSNWPNNLTTRTLKAYSISAEVEFPLNAVLDIIDRELGYSRFCDLVSEWREALIDGTK